MPPDCSAPGFTKEEFPPKWPEPLDIFFGESIPSPLLTSHHVPAAIFDFAADCAIRMGVDSAAVALAGVVSCAAVITDDWTLQPKRYDTSWTENARLWGAIVGDPSILKSPVISAATNPIDRLEEAARHRYAEEMRAWRPLEAKAKQDKTVPPPPPKLDRFMAEGTTIEALSEILRDDEGSKMNAPARKVLSRQDEMSEFLGNLDRYKAGGKGGGDRGAYLRLYNGGRHTVDRVGRGSFAVSNWSACFIGGIQPGPIQRIAREAADDGLLQRFMFIVPGRQAPGVDQPPSHTTIERYLALFPALVALTPARGIGNGRVPPVVFHGDAHKYREEINALAEGLGAMPDTPPRLQSSFGKWPGLFARLCLTFHLIEVADCRARQVETPLLAVIPEHIALRVAAFMREILLPHAMRADAVMFATNQSGHARWIAGYILAKKMQRIAVRDVVQAYKALRAPETRRDLDFVMASLAACGWLEPEEPSNFVKGVCSWHVNPNVHHKFAVRAAGEAKARQESRATIAMAAAIVHAIRTPKVS